MLRQLIALFATALVSAGGFDLVRLADGVYATVRKEPPGFAVESNSVFIIGPSDVLVVDAQSTLAATRETLAALRTVTDKPVRYLVNTHWHDDHIVGNRVYREAFPGVQFIAHAAARDYLQGPGIAARARFHRDDVPAFSGFLEKALAQGKNMVGQPLDDEERRSYQSDLQLAQGYASVPPDFRPELPDLTLSDNLTLYQGEREIQIRYLGRGHTSGDLVVWLPKERIACAGDLVVWPIPLIGGDQSHVLDWPATLGRLLALEPQTLVPGHGPIMHELGYPRQLQALLTAVANRTRAALAQGAAADKLSGQVRLDDFDASFAGQSTVRRALFKMYVAGPAILSAAADLAATKQ
jgi:glyoxylase-like metal-dependent hydrolase (beta-lactamase superfamily II)